MNPFNALRQHLDGLKLPSNAAFFVLNFGIGDRIRFLSYLHLFDYFNACTSYVVVVEQESAELLEFYPELLAGRVISIPKTLLVQPIQLTHYAIGDDRPGPHRIYFTWHVQYHGVQNQMWERAKHENVTHDLMVKQILNVPAVFPPRMLTYIPHSGPKVKTIYLAPCNVSNFGLPQPIWLSLAQALTESGYAIICNARAPASNMHENQDFGELFSKYPTVNCGLVELVDRVARSAGIVTVRSGLSDLFSLTSCPLVSLTHDRIGPFWNLPVNFGNHHEINLDRIPVAQAITAANSFFLNQQT